MINSVDRYGVTALHFAVETGYLPVVRLLVDYGASLTTRTQSGYTALDKAAFYGRVDVVEFLVGQEIYATVLPDLGVDTPLIFACTGAAHGYDTSRVVRYLLENGRDMWINHVGTRGMTALHHAAMAGQLELVQLLIEHRADSTIQDQDGCTPLARAQMAEKQDIVAFLLSYSANAPTAHSASHDTSNESTFG